MRPAERQHSRRSRGASRIQEIGFPSRMKFYVVELAKEDKKAHGDFDSECPGAQNTFYVGRLKGVGRIYQKTLIDTYSKVAFTKLYDRGRR